jgi:hypothetical protein
MERTKLRVTRQVARQLNEIAERDAQAVLRVELAKVVFISILLALAQ